MRQPLLSTYRKGTQGLIERRGKKNFVPGGPGSPRGLRGFPPVGKRPVGETPVGKTARREKATGPPRGHRPNAPGSIYTSTLVTRDKSKSKSKTSILVIRDNIYIYVSYK